MKSARDPEPEDFDLPDEDERETPYSKRRGRKGRQRSISSDAISSGGILWKVIIVLVVWLAILSATQTYLFLRGVSTGPAGKEGSPGPAGPPGQTGPAGKDSKDTVYIYAKETAVAVGDIVAISSQAKIPWGYMLADGSDISRQYYREYFDVKKLNGSEAKLPRVESDDGDVVYCVRVKTK